MKTIVRRNIVLVLTVIVMLVLNMLSTMTIYGGITIEEGLIDPAISTMSYAHRQQATATATQAPAADTDKRVPRIAFIANRNGATNIYTMNPDGSGITRLTNSNKFELFPTWSPDGRSIAFLVGGAAGKPPELMVMGADGTNVRKVNIGKAKAISPPCWSPDSSQIAYISVRTQAVDSGLYIVDVAANSEKKVKTSLPVDFSFDPPADGVALTVALTDAYAPSWSPDGKSILFFGGQSLYPKTTLIFGLDGKMQRPFLRDSSIVATNASWSLDGSKVLFVGLQEMGQYTRFSLQIADAQGNILAELPPDPTLIPRFPAFSPDAKQIVFAGISFTTQKARIYVMNADGSNLRQLTDDAFSAGDAWPSWGLVPDELVKR